MVENGVREKVAALHKLITSLKNEIYGWEEEYKDAEDGIVIIEARTSEIEKSIEEYKGTEKEKMLAETLKSVNIVKSNKLSTLKECRYQIKIIEKWIKESEVQLKELTK